MKKLKLFTLAIAALLTGNALAAEPYTPTKVYKVGDESTLGETWASKGQPSNYFISGDTTIFSVFLCYQSAGVGKQEWIGYTNTGSANKTYEALECFKGSAAWGTGDAGTNATKTKLSRIYEFNVTNCSSVLVLQDLNGTTSKSNSACLKAYEIVDGTVSATAAKEATVTEDGLKVIKLEGLDGSKTYQIQANTSADKDAFIYEIAFVTAPVPADNATLKSITIDGVALEGFDPATESYNVTLPYGTTTVPVVAAVCTSSKANAVVTPAADVNSAATIVVTAEDGTTTKTYTINFSVAATQSSNAFLSGLTVDGKTISGFKKDSFNYNYQVAYNKTEYPVVAATVEDATATLVISPITSYPASATVVVTAQDGTTTQTYTINFTKATYPKVISSIVFSNGAKGAANESEATVKVPYLSTDAAAPTISEITVLADNEYIKADDESTITVSSKTDLSSLVYNVTKVALTPASIATNEEIAFDGTESYVFSTYGFDASKGWKFAKAKEDESNRRVSDGRSRIYFALPAAKEVVLTSGTGGERGIKVFVNNVENTNVTTTAAEKASITIALNSDAANLVAIESNQTKGDGGFIKIKLVPVDGGNPDTSIDAINSNATAVKRIVNGQLVIEKNGVLYNALGNVVK